MIARRRLDDLTDGDLTERGARRVRRHLAGCTRCRAVAAALAATIDDVARLGRLPAPGLPSVRDVVAARIVADDGPGTARRPASAPGSHDAGVGTR